MSMLSFDKILRIISIIVQILVSALKMVDPQIDLDPDKD